MDKIYIVTAGDYSDYHIVTVFSSRELAEKFCTKFGDPDYEYEIEEYELDSFRQQLNNGLNCFNVSMCADGSLLDDVDKDYNEEVILSGKTNYRIYKWDQERLMLHITCMAENRQHAIKIANEIRTQLIATNNFVLGYNNKTVLNM